MKKFNVRKLAICLIMSVLLLAQTINVFAENSIRTEGMVQIQVGCEFPDGSFDAWASVPGFCISESTYITARQYLPITEESPIYTDTMESKASGYKVLGMDVEDYSSLKFTYRVAIDGELMKAKIVNVEGTTVLSVTDTESPYIYSLSSEEVTEETEVYAIGYVASAMSTSKVATTGDVIVQPITINEVDNSGNILFSIDSGDVFKGGALSTEDGIIAIIKDVSSGTGVAEPIGDLTSALGNTVFKTTDLDTAELEKLIEEAKAIQKEPYTEDSVALLDSAVADAELTVQDMYATQADVDFQLQFLQSAIDSLEEQPTGILAFFSDVPRATMVLFGIVAVAFLMIVIIIVKTIFDKKKLDKSEEKDETEDEFKESDPEKEISEEKVMASNPPAPVKEDIAATPEESILFTSPSYVMDDLTLADTGAEDTDVLGGKIGVLVHYDKSNYSVIERIPVDLERFVIGKEKDKTNYTIKNRTVSRTHAEIRMYGSEFYIQDLGSTNHTSVDGVQLEPNVLHPLTNGAKIIISDEPFTFEIQ